MNKFFLITVVILCNVSLFGQTTIPVKFTAKVTNRNSDTLYIRGANNFMKVIPINKKEIFSLEFEAAKGFYQLTDGKEATNIYLKPNSDINLTFDAKEFDETLLYKGKGVDENNFLAQQSLRDERFLKDAFDKESVEFTNLLEEKKKADIQNIEKGDYDPEFKTALKKSYEQFYFYAAQKYDKIAKANKLKGKASPNFDYENYKGGKTKLSDLKGKYVYIDLWATWCGPCRVEIPYLQKIEEKYHGKNIEFVSISIDQAKDYQKWKKFVADKNLGGVQLFADKDWQSEFVTSFDVTGIPRFILIDPNGNIADSDASRPSSPELVTQLDSLLK